MIYLLLGNDTKKKNVYLKKLCKNNQQVFALSKNITKEFFFEQAGNVSLFGESPIIVLEEVIKQGDIDFSPDDLSVLQNSDTVFVFLEEKLLATDLKKLKKYVTLEEFNLPVLKTIPKTNIFNIADAFSRRDKIDSWILYRQAISTGTTPEEISGIIFWKIKTMILSGTKMFSMNELKNQSSSLVSLYHEAHRGECDFTIGLEQFILSSLSK